MSSAEARVLPQIRMESLASSSVERWLPTLGLTTILVVCLGSPALAAGLSPWPFLIAAAVLGLPHGAADGVILLRGLDWPERIRRILGYLTLMAARAPKR